MENKHIGISFETTLMEDLSSSDELVYLYIKDAVENPSITPNGSDYDYLLKAIFDVAKARSK